MDPFERAASGRARASASAPLLSVRDLAVTYEGAALTRPSAATFDVSPGEVVLLLGPSGSGKSTLALTLNGLIPHAVPADATGRVVVAGMDAADTPVATLSTHVAMVFQDPDAQLVTGSVLDEVAFGPENLLLPADVVLARAEESLRRVGLWERRGENPDALSGGGRQRLAIAAALAMGAPLLVLDEPTANLDPAGIEEVYAALADVVATGDRAIVLVEHNLDAAMDLVDRVVVLDAAGAVIAEGPARTVLRERAAELRATGVWLPTATLAALRLRAAGYAIDPLPLTPAELHAALAALPAASGPAPPAPRSARHAAPDAAPLVRVRGLEVVRGRGRERRRVLQGVDLDIAAGEFVAIVGANGAGKTTLAQAIAGVRRPPRGTVTVAGDDIARLDPRRLSARIGFVFQNPEHQFIAATVFDEIAHGLRLQGLPEQAVTARTNEMLDRFGLSPLAEVHPFLLSGGQKRRLSVGTALVAGAEVVVLDEPTFGQDRARADALLRLLSDLRNAGTAIIVVSHDMQLVAEHADRMIVMEAGRIAAAAPTAAVFADEALLRRAGLRHPPLGRALQSLPAHPELDGLTRLADLPGGTS